jgi:predicted transcriptional regulator
MEMKTIGIRVPKDSDLMDRLKRIAERERVSYHVLLDKWLTQEESARGRDEISKHFEEIEARLCVIESKIGL